MYELFSVRSQASPREQRRLLFYSIIKKNYLCIPLEKGASLGDLETLRLFI